jgi:hypothetical protein
MSKIEIVNIIQNLVQSNLIFKFFELLNSEFRLYYFGKIILNVRFGHTNLNFK